jgi:hypothetical protein
MKNKLLALLISIGTVSGIFGFFLLLFYYPTLGYAWMVISWLCIIYLGYKIWLKKLNNKNK